jgi:hypothetical protein
MMLGFGGGSLRSVEQTVQLPTTLWGDSVYIRLSAYRFGPTPVGLTLSKYPSIVSLSTLHRDTSVGYSQTPRWLSSSFTDTLYREYVSRIVDYWLVDTARPCLPIVFGFDGLPPTYDTLFTSLVQSIGRTRVPSYCDCIEAWLADSATVYATLHPPVDFAKRISGRRSAVADAQRLRPRMDVRIAGGRYTVNVNGQPVAASVCAYSIRGERIGVVWSGTLPAQFELRDNELPSGCAILVLQVPSLSLVQAVKVLSD